MSISKSFYRPKKAQWSYWERELGWDRTLASYFSYRPLENNYDFVVVGAGFTGLSAVYHLAKNIQELKLLLLIGTYLHWERVPEMQALLA